MNVTFSKIAKIWLDSELFGKDYSYQFELKSATQHLVNYFGEMSCCEIKGMTVDNFIKYEYENNNPNTGRPYSKRILNEHINVGNRIFEYALDNELIPNIRNPFNAKRKRIPKNAPVKERLPINDTQKSLILKVYHPAQIASLIMLYCGLRKGEIIPLEWSDIDLKNNIISVTKSVTRKDSNNFAIKPHTKNGKDRYIPIPDNLIPFLKLERFSSGNKKYVYSQKNSKLHTITTWDRTWKSYQTQLNYRLYSIMMEQKGEKPKSIYSPSGIPEVMDKFIAHQLRHTYCTMLYFSGVDILTTSKLMGHSSVQITLEIYTHLDEKFKKLNINKFNDYIRNDETNQISAFKNKNVI